MTRKQRLLLSIAAMAIMVTLSIIPTAAAEEPYTAAEEEYMRKQAAKYYVADDPIEESIDAETGEIAWKAVPAELRESAAERVGGSLPARSAANVAAEATAERRRQEKKHNIRSYSSAAAVEWGIPAVTIPAVVVQGTEDTIWGTRQSFTAPPKKAYKVLNKGTEIRIALLTDRVDLPEGVVGLLTRAVLDSRGGEILPQATQIFGRYNYYDQAIAWKHVVLDGEIVKLDENAEEFQSPISLTERTEPGYKISIHIKNTVLLVLPII